MNTSNKPKIIPCASCSLLNSCGDAIITRSLSTNIYRYIEAAILPKCKNLTLYLYYKSDDPSTVDVTEAVQFFRDNFFIELGKHDL